VNYFDPKNHLDDLGPAADAPIYVLLVHNGVGGHAFCLDRRYALTTGDKIIPRCVSDVLIKRAIAGETDPDWFPSLSSQAPAWAWCEKAHKSTFTAYWFDPQMTIREAVMGR
jgi:hypothetical protein